MKTTVLLLIFSLMCFGGVQAQEYFNFGIKGGVNFGNFAGDDAEESDFKVRTGFHIGVLAEIMLAERFALQPEILYSSQGGKATLEDFDEFMGENMDVQLKLDYISVPVLLKYFVIPGLSIEAGPQFSFTVDSQAEVSFEGEEASVDITDETEKFDLGLAVGLGYGLPQGFLVQARYARGFSDVYTDSDIRNTLFQVSVGYKF